MRGDRTAFIWIRAPWKVLSRSIGLGSLGLLCTRTTVRHTMTIAFKQSTRIQFSALNTGHLTSDRVSQITSQGLSDTQQTSHTVLRKCAHYSLLLLLLLLPFASGGERSRASIRCLIDCVYAVAATYNYTHALNGVYMRYRNSWTRREHTLTHTHIRAGTHSELAEFGSVEATDVW